MASSTTIFEIPFSSMLFFVARFAGFHRKRKMSTIILLVFYLAIFSVYNVLFQDKYTVSQGSQSFRRERKGLYSLRPLRFMACFAIQKNKYCKVRKAFARS